jgi:hypothetical protein
LKANLAITRVARNAKKATKIPDGILVVLLAFADTKSGPNTESNSTASHIMLMAREPQTSGIRHQRAGSRAGPNS